jgi:pimeloyl-ACP methyl ester carboxylesterase
MGRASQLGPKEAMRLFVENALSRSAVALWTRSWRIGLRTLRRRGLVRARAQAHTTRWVGSATFAHDCLHGTADDVVDAGNAPLIANAIPGARLELFEGVGHLLPWERPAEFVALVEEFLA